MKHGEPFKCTIIADRLAFEVQNRVTLRPKPSRDIVFCIDGLREFRYQPFNNDFGPFSLPVVYRFCQKLLGVLSDPGNKGRTVVFRTNGHDVHQLPNAAFLIGAFQILYLGRSADEAFAPLAPIAAGLKPFRDAGYGACSYDLTVHDCLLGLYQGFIHGFVDFSDFDDAQWEFFEQVENGDFNWLVPGRFLAFAGPHKETILAPGQYPRLAPSHYFNLFRERGISDIVRLNKPIYERQDFIEAGFNHHELFFTDGSCPPARILDNFLHLCRTSKGAIAVHCKAGLGRTGSLIGCFLMEEYRFTAAEAIAWMRICRPGCVIGPQQYYLHQKEADMWAMGEARGRVRREHFDGKEHPKWVLDANMLVSVERVTEGVQGLTLASSSESLTPEKHKGLVATAGRIMRRLSILSAGSDLTADSEEENEGEPGQGDYLNARKLFRHSKGLKHTTSASPFESALRDRDQAVFV